MFEVNGDDIAQLNDIDLRALIGLLCEVELHSRGLSTAAVIWGGSQTAPDGGLDVRVSLAADIDGYIPRSATGFQVKKPEMASAAITKEMKPKGDIRPVIRQLIADRGAYVIVSSGPSVADGPLAARIEAMKDVMAGTEGAEDGLVDFYDRSRVASWVRLHPGVVWVKARIGQSVSGWRPHESWVGQQEAMEAEYIVDEKVRLQFPGELPDDALPLVAAIDKLRKLLVQPGSMVRLVGLSGVGKTRLAQALFDSRIGDRPLPQPSLCTPTFLRKRAQGQ